MASRDSSRWPPLRPDHRPLAADVAVGFRAAPAHWSRRLVAGLFAGWLLIALGCGTTKSQMATEQLLTSDAVDMAVAAIDFSPLAGQRVFLDDQYIKNVKGFGFVNAEYITSSLRQQIAAANCMIAEKADDADLVLEARVGALGTNQHDVVYGIPASAGVSMAADVMPNVPKVPALPEISLARKDTHVGAAKLAVFAYDRTTREAIWQSGMSQAKTDARHIWVFGAGPIQVGSIYDRVQIAGERLTIPYLYSHNEQIARAPVDYKQPYLFPRLNWSAQDGLPGGALEQWARHSPHEIRYSESWPPPQLLPELDAAGQTPGTAASLGRLPAVNESWIR